MAKKVVTKRQEQQARAIVQQAVDEQRARDAAEKRKLIGRCFKYRNSFSDGERWWLYAVVTAVDEYGRITTTEFQNNTMQNLSLAVDAYGGLIPGGGWTEITASEFRDASVDIANVFLQRLVTAMSLAAVDPHADIRESGPRA